MKLYNKYVKTTCTHKTRQHNIITVIQYAYWGRPHGQCTRGQWHLQPTLMNTVVYATIWILAHMYLCNCINSWVMEVVPIYLGHSTKYFLWFHLDMGWWIQETLCEMIPLQLATADKGAWHVQWHRPGNFIWIYIYIYTKKVRRKASRFYGVLIRGVPAVLFIEGSLFQGVLMKFL